MTIVTSMPAMRHFMSHCVATHKGVGNGFRQLMCKMGNSVAFAPQPGKSAPPATSKAATTKANSREGRKPRR
jgi:hypothetical protein